MILASPFTPAPSVKVMINIGALLDIPTGTFIIGRNGESILNGGLAPLTGIVGIGNNFKSTLMHYMSFTSIARMKDSSGSTYDTEVNMHEWHLTNSIKRIFDYNYLPEELNILESGRWVITDKTVYTGNKWYEMFKTFAEDKIKRSEKLSVDTPFWNRDKTGPLKIILPTASEIDSFSEFETEDVMAMQDENELGESGANTLHMRQGLAKMRFLMEAVRINPASYNYMIMTAHIGKESTMQKGAGGKDVPVSKLKHLKNGDAIKQVTNKFTFVTHNCWHAYNAAPLIQSNGDGPEYPRDSEDKLKYDTDLNTVQVRNLRSKSGVSGMATTLIVSQSEGVLPSLSEFHYIKEMGKYGLEGNNLSYALCIYPDVKLSRTTVRGKIDSDSKLRRALNITSEMCQMSNMWHHVEEDVLCTPKQLYDDLKAQGYDWDLLLSTRGWWTYNNEKHPIPFLSTMDFLRMRVGKYFPYWMTEDKKSIKKEYINL